MNQTKKVIPLNRAQQSMNNLPEPLMPAHADLSDWGFMPLDVRRFRDSKFSAVIDPEAGFYAIQLWAASWHCVPSASLPNNDRELCQLCGLGRDLSTWERIKAGALYGWKLCSDGRYYHPVLAEKALEAWVKKLHQRLKSGWGNAARWHLEFSEEQDLLSQYHDAWARLKAICPTSDLILKGNPLSKSNTNKINPTGIPSGNQQGIPELSQVKVSKGKVSKGKVSNSSSAQARAAAFDSLIITSEIQEFAIQNGIEHLDKRLDHFKSRCKERDYKPDNPIDLFKQALIEDWAKLNKEFTSKVGSTPKRGGKHTGFNEIDYTAGVNEDGSF